MPIIWKKKDENIKVELLKLKTVVFNAIEIYLIYGASYIWIFFLYGLHLLIPLNHSFYEKMC